MLENTMSIFRFLMNRHCSPWWLHQFTFPLTVEEVSLFPHPLQHLLLIDIFDDGHSDQCEVIIHCGFDLHFSISKGFPGDSVGEKKIHQQCRRPRFSPLEEEMATHSSILAWRIPWTEEPGGLQRLQSQM